MSDYFKKFIDTSGKSLDEIKKIAEKMAKRTAKTAVKAVLDEAEKTVQREIRRKIQEVVNEAKTIAENNDSRAESCREERSREAADAYSR